MATFIDTVVSLAKEQWDFFGNQEYDTNYRRTKDGKDETDEGFWQRVGVYWLEGTGKNLTGKNDDYPWSAAFVSYLMRKAGAGERFKYSSQHSVYIREAIKAKLKSNDAYGFWGHRINEYAPKIGDLVCYARQAGVSYDTPSASYKSHADLVVSINGETIQVIGGNVGNSVSLKNLAIDKDGHLIDTNHKWFAILENRIDLPV